MSDEHRTGSSATAKPGSTGGRWIQAQGIAAFVAVVVLLNVVPRLTGMPDVGLPSISFPDLPDWLGTVLHVKNWILGGLLLVVVVCVGLDQLDKHRKAGQAEPRERA